MNHFQAAKLLLLFSAIFSGCKSATLSPRESFLLATKTQKTDYIQLYEVSPEVLRDRDEEVFKATKVAIHGARDAMLKSTNSNFILQQRLELIERFAGILRSNRMEIINRLEKQYNPKTDTSLYYHSQINDHEELGLAIMCGRRIKEKIVVYEAFANGN